MTVPDAIPAKDSNETADATTTPDFWLGIAEYPAKGWTLDEEGSSWAPIRKNHGTVVQKMGSLFKRL